MDLGSILASASQYKVTETKFTVTAVVQQAIGPNPNRVAIHFGDGAGGTFIAQSSANCGASIGCINLTTTLPNWRGTFWEFGPYVQGPFFAVKTAGTSSLIIAEIVYVPTGG